MEDKRTQLDIIRDIGRIDIKIQDLLLEIEKLKYQRKCLEVDLSVMAVEKSILIGETKE